MRAGDLPRHQGRHAGRPCAIRRHGARRGFLAGAAMSARRRRRAGLAARGSRTTASRPDAGALGRRAAQGQLELHSFVERAPRRSVGCARTARWSKRLRATPPSRSAMNQFAPRRRARAAGAVERRQATRSPHAHPTTPSSAATEQRDRAGCGATPASETRARSATTTPRGNGQTRQVGGREPPTRPQRRHVRRQQLALTGRPARAARRAAPGRCPGWRPARDRSERARAPGGTSTIFCAVTGPTPGSVSSCSALAVLSEIGAAGPAAAA